jgi:UDP-N-acetylglucosamine diphosphorylase / glucose-1-phosphate thymidylyltransferase / UDP-N-acetylgalactosamine diphosphorylase / glucosamine-1-phosphate N-acetyltransferase / galactosamine-1-phosphate N-acetyltransferase
MQAVILAAGKGKRMNHLTKSTPKPMLTLKGRPVLEYKIDTLPSEIKEIIFIVGYYREQIMNHFKNNYKGRKITYIIQDKLNGTGGAIHLAKGILKDKFLVLMGDDLYHKQDIKKLIKNEVAVLGYEVDDPSRFGIIKTDSKKNMLEIIENPKSDKYRLTNTGAYVLNKKFFSYDLVPKKAGDKEFGLPQTLALMARDVKVKVVKARIWQPISNPEDLEKAERVLNKFGVRFVESEKEKKSKKIQKNKKKK